MNASPDTGSGFLLSLPADALRPLVREIVAEVLSAAAADRAALGATGGPADRLAYGEAEAARLIGLHAHQLRDERLRGRIAASKIVGGRIAYMRDDLLEYLMRRRVSAEA